MRLRLHGPAECAVALVLIGAGSAQVAPDSSPPRVTLNAGELEGTRFGTGKNDVAFLGVRYAALPVGELRWKPPESVSSWSGTRKATKFGAVLERIMAPILANTPGETVRPSETNNHTD